MIKVKISNTDANADWIKWRTDDANLGPPVGGFLGAIRGESPPPRSSPFAGVVRRKGRKRSRRRRDVRSHGIRPKRG